MQPLDPVRQGLMNIIRTQYRDILGKISDILDYADAHPDRKAALLGDALCWWNAIPLAHERTNAVRFPFTRRQRGEADAAVDALVAQNQLAPDDPFEQGLPPDRVGELVLAELEKAKAHGQLHQLMYFHGILSGSYVPYIGHLTVSDPDPVTVEQMHTVAVVHPDELSALEAIYQSDNKFSALSAWILALDGRMDARTAHLLAGYAIARLVMITHQATQMMMAQGAMPMMIRLGGPPPDDEGGSGGTDPKKAN